MTDRGHGRLIGESTTTRSYQSMEQSEAQIGLPYDERGNIIYPTPLSQEDERRRSRPHYEIIMAQLLPEENQTWSTLLIIFVISFIVLLIVRIVSHPFFLK